MALLPADPKQQQKMLLGFLPLALLFGYWYFFHGKKMEEITALETRLEQLETKNAAAQARARAGGSDLEQALAEVEAQITRLEELVPRSEDLPDLLHAISLRAQDHDIDLAKMTPGDPQPNPYYTLQTYDMIVYGGYHEVGQFLTAIGSLPRIVTPTTVSIIPRPRTDPDEPQRVQTNFRIKTYVLPAPETAPAGEEAAPNASS